MSKWRPIESAPRDGSHILVASDETPGFGIWRDAFGEEEMIPMMTVAHWWANPGEEGFYPSVCEQEQQKPLNVSHWMPLTKLPGFDHLLQFQTKYQGSNEVLD